MIALGLKGLESVFGWLLEASWQASVLAALVLFVQWLLGPRLNPRWRYTLWLLVLLRLVLPILPESAFSLFQYAPKPSAALTAPVTEPLFLSTPDPSPQVHVVPMEQSEPLSLYSLLALAWLAGALFLLALTWRVNRRFALQIRKSPEITDPELLEIFATAQAGLGLHRSIRLIENAHVQSPAIMGLFQPTLLLPADVRAKFDPTELRLIFLHELAHLKRGDVIAQWLIAVLQILHWFNPALWFAFRRMRADREPATDALVLSRTGEDEKEIYGLMLIKLLEHFNQRHSLPTLVGILEDKDQFKRRFSLIARFTRGAYGWSLLGVFLIGVLSAVGLTRATPGSGIDDESDLVSRLPKNPALDQTLVNLMRVGFTDKVGKGDADKASELLAEGADPNAKDSRGTTALTWALNFGKDDAAKLLIRYGADGSVKNSQGENAAWLAAQIYYCPGALKLLIKKGVNVTDLNKRGQTILESITTAGPAGPGKMNYLHDRIWTAAEYQAYEEREHRTVDLLVGAGVDFNGKDGAETPLMRLIRSGHYEAARALLGHGPNLAIKDKDGHTVLDLTREAYANRLDSDPAKKELKSTLDMLEAMDKGAIKTTDASGPGEDLFVVRTFLFPDGFFETKSRDTVDIKRELIGHGIEFSGDATAIYLPAQNKFVVRNTREQLDKIATLIATFPNTPVKPQTDAIVPSTDLPPPTTIPIQPSAEASDKIPAGFVRVSAKVLQISDEDYQAHRSAIDDAAKKGDYEPLSHLNSFDLLNKDAELIKSGEQGVMENVRVLPYPIAHQKDKDGKMVPTDFKKKNIGVRFPLVPVINNGKIVITGSLEVTTLRAWILTDDNTFQPVFNTRRIQLASVAFDSGQTIGIQAVGLQADAFQPDAAFGPNYATHEPPRSKAPRRLFLFLTALAGPPLTITSTGNESPSAGKADAVAPATDASANPRAASTSETLAQLALALHDSAKSIPTDHQRLQILKGFYGADGSWRDVTGILQKSVQNNSLKVSWQQPYTEIGGDPAFLQVKTLVVSYRLDGVEKLATFREENPPVGLQATIPPTPASTSNAPADPSTASNQTASSQEPGKADQTINPSPPQANATGAATAKNTQIKIEFKLAEITEDTYQAHKTAIDSAMDKGGFALIDLLNNMKGISLLSAPSVTTQPGLKANIDIVREFPYPTSFDNPLYISGSNGGPNLSIPPTPRKFVTKDLGVSAEIMPSLAEENSPDHGKIILNGKLSVTDFEGFTKSNLVHTGTPAFNTRESLFFEALDNDQLKAIWIPGEHGGEETMVDGHIFMGQNPSGKKIGPTKFVKKRLLLFLSAKLVE